MVQYCRKCGKELDDDAEFCDSCGFNLNGSLTDKNENTTQKDKKEFATKLPLILAVIGIIVSIAEGLGTPILMGWDNIMFAMLVGVVGGLLGIFLMEKLDEPLIAAVEFIATGALIFMFIARFGEISVVLFIITAVLTLYLKGYYGKNKKLWLIPILTVVLIFMLIFVGGAVYQINAENSVTIDNFTQNITNDGFGYYDGYLTGDIKVDSNFEYLCVNIDYYDSQGKVIKSDIGWNDFNVEGGKTYKISNWYFEKTPPVKAEIKVTDTSEDKAPLCAKNVTLSTKSGV